MVHAAYTCEITCVSCVRVGSRLSTLVESASRKDFRERVVPTLSQCAIATLYAPHRAINSTPPFRDPIYKVLEPSARKARDLGHCSITTSHHHAHAPSH
jgi:hypothetical protein